MKGPPGTGSPEHRYAVVTADLVMSRGLDDLAELAHRELLDLLHLLSTLLQCLVRG